MPGLVFESITLAPRPGPLRGNGSDPPEVARPGIELLLPDDNSRRREAASRRLLQERRLLPGGDLLGLEEKGELVLGDATLMAPAECRGPYCGSPGAVGCSDGGNGFDNPQLPEALEDGEHPGPIAQLEADLVATQAEGRRLLETSLPPLIEDATLPDGGAVGGEEGEGGGLRPRGTVDLRLDCRSGVGAFCRALLVEGQAQERVTEKKRDLHLRARDREEERLTPRRHPRLGAVAQTQLIAPPGVEPRKRYRQEGLALLGKIQGQQEFTGFRRLSRFHRLDINLHGNLTELRRRRGEGEFQGVTAHREGILRGTLLEGEGRRRLPDFPTLSAAGSTPAGKKENEGKQRDCPAEGACHLHLLRFLITL